MGVRIKICGITDEEDGRQAGLLGADAIGLNFYPRSPRYVSEEKAARIIQRLPPLVEPVGLFVNEPLVEIVEQVRRMGVIRTIQWHGDNHELPPTLYHFIPAFQVHDAGGLAAVKRYLQNCRAAGRLPAALLIDGHVPGEYGGTGRTAPWKLLADFHPEVPVILAGGLTPDNVAEAIRLVGPYGVDVASGVESNPGKKDLEKVRRFIDCARNAECKKTTKNTKSTKAAKDKKR
jgi:phosphoribosylanthranilate isomerase